MAPSLWKRPGTKTFQLVHRSQRDPLINDPTASDRVLKLVDKGQKRKNADGVTSYAASDAGGPAPVADDLDDAALAAGDAAAYGIFYDDADDYDYLQHLRSVGAANSGDAYLVEAPVQNKQKGKRADAGGFQLSEAALARQDARDQGQFEMPDDALPSHPLDEIPYADVMASKAPTRGLQPDLDPSVREVLEALDDEAYAADDGTGTDDEDEFWGGVLEGGEVSSAREQEWDDDEGVDGAAAGVRGLQLGAEQGGDDEGEGEGSWAAVKAFQAAGGAGRPELASDDEEVATDDDFASEGGDTIGALRASMTKRPARKALTHGGMSAFSMSSSAMVRNKGLQTLDEQFDQIEKLYDESDDDSWGGSHHSGSDDESALEPQGAARADLERIMDDFLSKYEVIGGKFRPALAPLHGSGGAEDASLSANASRLDRLRHEMARLDLGDEEEGEDPEVTARRREKERILAIVERQDEEADKGGARKVPRVTILEEARRDRWDCETVLSTYSNLSNHPRMLRLRDFGRTGGSNSGSNGRPHAAQIKIDPKTGFPTVDGVSVLDARPRRGKKGQQEEQEDAVMEEDEEEEEDEEDYVPREVIKRPRAEATDDKKARKAAVKAERAARRVEKKGTKEAFSSEVKRQKRIEGRRVADGASADIRSGQEGVRRLA
ncbi:hypothetical protein JCM3775_005201 [Rhodotorula graminis]|uniref:Low temperature viability protein n=1 Tax=Rhodotorula graminis (strain WP1) TaxID=578459 RepID=A0A0P9EKQ5_RHOGW|nr:uncharacterized protein RHOBADRAFT_56085 [Rhodotorula graminis WP1]KPV72272.1 hypothetical protein RHOBADRAFT_56085 [Rhodotorula graminis WP1]